MRSKFTQSLLAAFVVASTTAAYTGPTFAWPAHQDHVYADSFGNLVIDSAAGYKRILVGEGSMAKKLADYTGAGQPDVVYLDRAQTSTEAADCYRPPVFVKGRSYMYGLSDGEMPELSPCQ